MLTYMTAISTSGISREKIFEYASQLPGNTLSKYMKKIHLLSRNYNFEYSRACLELASRVNNTRIKDMLSRMANALTSGQPDQEFLEEELETEIATYTNKYERDVESLKKWTDGYTALMVSLTLIVLVVILSIMIFSKGDTEGLGLTVSIVMTLITSLAVYTLSRSAPVDPKIHNLEEKPPEQAQIQKLVPIILPITAAVAIGFSIFLGVGWAMIAVGLLLLPVGLIGLKDDMNIERRDVQFASFIQILGTSAGTMGSTLMVAMERMDKDSLGVLENELKRLYTRISLGMDDETSWMKFAGETGSEIIARGVKIFLDAIKLGGDPSEIGRIVSTSTHRLNLLRLKRNSIARGFSGLVIPLHTAMVALLVVVTNILTAFNTRVNEMHASEIMKNTTAAGGLGGSIPTASVGIGAMGPEALAFAHSFTIMTVIVLTIANTMAVKSTTGGAFYKIFYYGGILTSISGVLLVVLPPIVKSIFSGQIV